MWQNSAFPQSMVPPPPPAAQQSFDRTMPGQQAFGQTMMMSQGPGPPQDPRFASMYAPQGPPQMGTMMMSQAPLPPPAAMGTMMMSQRPTTMMQQPMQPMQSMVMQQQMPTYLRSMPPPVPVAPVQHHVHAQHVPVHHVHTQHVPVHVQPNIEFEMEPEYYERVVEVPKIGVELVEKVVEVPEPQIIDRIVEVPQVQEVIKEVPKIEVQMITREVPKIEVRQMERFVDVPQIHVQDRFVEVTQVREVVRKVPRIEVHEIPIERIIQVPKKVIQEIEQPVYRPVPTMVRVPVEREIPVPKVQVQTVEVVKQIPVPQIVDVEVDVPQYVPQYIDIEPQRPTAVAMPPQQIVQQVPLMTQKVYAPQMQVQIPQPVHEQVLVHAPVAHPTRPMVAMAYTPPTPPAAMGLPTIMQQQPLQMQQMQSFQAPAAYTPPMPVYASQPAMVAAPPMPVYASQPAMAMAPAPVTYAPRPTMPMYQSMEGLDGGPSYSNVAPPGSMMMVPGQTVQQMGSVRAPQPIPGTTYFEGPPGAAFPGTGAMAPTPPVPIY